MADAFAFSSRRLPSAQRRTPLPPSAACLDVQWTFLTPQSLPPTSPHHRTHSHETPQAAKPQVRLVDRFDNANARDKLLTEQAQLRAAKEAAEFHDQRVLYDLMGETQRQAMLDKVMAEMEAMALMPVRRLASPRHGRHHHQATNQPTITRATRRSSVLPTGVSQRDVELLPQRRMTALGAADTSALEAKGPAASDDSDHDSDDDSSGTDEDAEDSDTSDGENGKRKSGVDSHADDIPELRAIRDRQRRRTERTSIALEGRPRETHIRWQKTAHVCVAMDLPVALLADHDDHEDGEKEREGAPTDQDPLADLFPLSEETVHETQRRRSTRSPKKTTTTKKNADGSPPRSPPHPHDELASTRPKTLDVPKSPRVKKVAYGSWYVPRDEWWPLHQTQHDTLAELFPLEVPPRVERHRCERESHSPNQRRQPQHKDSLAFSQQSTHPHVWPSLLRSPVVSPRVVPLVRAARTVAGNRQSVAPPATSHAIRSPRLSSTVSYPTTPPATSASLLSSRRGTASPDRVETTTASSSSASPRTASLAAVPAAANTALPDAIALRAAVLQQEIPQAYIAREYRNYLAAKGARVPAFLNY